MRTPPGRPPNPNDPFTDTPHQGDELSAAEQHPAHARDDDDPLSAVPDDQDPPWSPYAPKYARRRSAPAPDVTSARGEAEPRDRGALQSGVDPNGDLHARPPSRRDAVADGHDVERLEASLRWLQRQEVAATLERGSRAAPAHRQAAVRHPGSERRGLPPPPSLEPERMAPPPAAAQRGRLRWLILPLIAAACIVPVFLYFSPLEEPIPEPKAEAQPQLALIKQVLNAPVGQEESAPVGARADESETVVPGAPVRPANAAPMESSSTGAAARVPPVEPAGPATPIPDKPLHVLGPEEVAALVKQGEQLIAVGDLVTARTAFRRAAEAGNVTAAIALGATFDPIVLAKLGVVGMASDIDQARNWYRKAERMGSAEATRRLQILANR